MFPLPTSRIWLAALALILMPIGAAFAGGDDAKDALKKAQAARLDAPAVRMTMVFTDLSTNSVTSMIVEYVKPSSGHTKVVVSGKPMTEMVTDGQKTFMRQGDAPYREAPTNVGALMMQSRQSAALDALIDTSSDVKLLGHETINGTPASIYTFKTTRLGLDTTAKIWIADSTNLPLKSESETHGEMQVGSSPGREVNRTSTVTFEYDPTLKITLPGS